MPTINESMENIDKILDEYECTLGLPKYKSLENDDKFRAELEGYLHMDRTTIEALTPDTCSEISLRLNQFAFNIQRSQNREKARMKWAISYAKRIVARDLNDGWSFEEKFLKAVANNDAAQKLIQIRDYCEQRMDRLDFLSQSLKELANSFKSIEFGKRKYAP